MILLNYNELKDFLKKNPFCFQPVAERKKEFDQRVIHSERKVIQFTEARNKARNLNA